MVFVIGLMFQATSPVASLFVAMHHNVTMNETEVPEDHPPEASLYTYGTMDVFAVFFYFLICIIIHAVIQEYILDKMNRRMHLSKVKHSKFNESGQLLTFYLMSAVWGGDIILRGNYASNISSLWEGYPHANLPFIIKFYFIIQIAYWIHCFPELYFQKVKKDEMPTRITYAVLYLIFITAAYLLNFNRAALCMMVLHYVVELVFHASRLLYFSDKTDVANTGFMAWNVLFVLVRLGTITLAVLTFWYGLEQTGQPLIDMAAGNFNTQIIRFNCLAAICLLQAWMMWNFINFHLRRRRERSNAVATKKLTPVQPKRKERKAKGRKEDDGSGDAAEDTTNTENGSVRQRTPRAKRS